MIRVVELKRRKDNPIKGDVIYREEFKSWKKAWEYMEFDLLHPRTCPCTKVIKHGLNDATIQHWGGWHGTEKECRCNEILEEEYQETKQAYNEMMGVIND